MKKIELKFGHLYSIHTSPDHTCDGCGTIYGEMTLVGMYDGSLDGAEWFIVYPWSCLICHNIHNTYRMLYSDVQKEFESLTHGK